MALDRRFAPAVAEKAAEGLREARALQCFRSPKAQLDHVSR